MSAVLRFLPFGTRAGNDPQTRINEVLRYRAEVRGTIDALRMTIARAPVSLINAVGTGSVMERDFRGLDLVLRPIVSHVQNAQIQATAAEYRIAGEENSYSAYSEELVALHKRLAEGGSKYKEFTQENVNELLAKVPDTIGRIVDDRHLHLTFLNVKMTPDINPYLNINGGKTVSIPMDRLVTSVNLSTGEVLIGGDTKREGGFRSQAHPHAMFASNPCLGGFEGTFYDACQKADIEVIALVLRFFLSQANQKDGAGKYWPRWMPSKIRHHRDNNSTNSAWHVGHLKLRAYNDYLIDSLGRSYIRDRMIVASDAGHGMIRQYKDLDAVRAELTARGVTPTDIEAAFSYIGTGVMSQINDFSRIW